MNKPPISGEAGSGEARARQDAWGWVLIGLGILGILWGVFHVLDAVGGPQRREFAHRLPYDEVKLRVHGSFLGGLTRSLAGLAVAMIGARLRAKAARDGERPAD